jgi:hypothetical protein
MGVQFGFMGFNSGARSFWAILRGPRPRQRVLPGAGWEMLPGLPDEEGRPPARRAAPAA